eukprot:gene11304-biopygen2963
MVGPTLCIRTLSSSRVHLPQHRHDLWFASTVWGLLAHNTPDPLVGGDPPCARSVAAGTEKVCLMRHRRGQLVAQQQQRYQRLMERVYQGMSPYFPRRKWSCRLPSRPESEGAGNEAREGEMKQGEMKMEGRNVFHRLL